MPRRSAHPCQAACRHRRGGVGGVVGRRRHLARRSASRAAPRAAAARLSPRVRQAELVDAVAAAPRPRSGGELTPAAGAEPNSNRAASRPSSSSSPSRARRSASAAASSKASREPPGGGSTRRGPRPLRVRTGRRRRRDPVAKARRAGRLLRLHLVVIIFISIVWRREERRGGRGRATASVRRGGGCRGSGPFLRGCVAAGWRGADRRPCRRRRPHPERRHPEGPPPQRPARCRGRAPPPHHARPHRRHGRPALRRGRRRSPVRPARGGALPGDGLRAGTGARGGARRRLVLKTFVQPGTCRRGERRRDRRRLRRRERDGQCGSTRRRPDGDGFDSQD